MPLIQLASGKQLFAEKHDRQGPSDTPDIPIVFVHGMYCNRHSWDPVLPSFSDYTRIVFDIEPFGDSRPTGGPLDTVSQARDVKEIIEYFGYSKVFLVGHSAGCTISIQTAHDYPDMVLKLILFGPLNLPIPEGWPLDWIGMPNEPLVQVYQSWGSKRAQADEKYLAAVRDMVKGNCDRKEDARRATGSLIAVGACSSDDISAPR